MVVASRFLREDRSLRLAVSAHLRLTYTTAAYALATIAVGAFAGLRGPFIAQLAAAFVAASWAVSWGMWVLGLYTPHGRLFTDGLYFVALLGIRQRYRFRVLDWLWWALGYQIVLSAVWGGMPYYDVLYNLGFIAQLGAVAYASR